MKIICITERKIEIEESCKKVYCCKKMEAAFTSRPYGKRSYDYDALNPCLTMTETGIEMETHAHYDHSSHYEMINFCPWCATPIKLERVKVDNTGLSPKEPEPTPPPEPVKKKHWWNL